MGDALNVAVFVAVDVLPLVNFIPDVVGEAVVICSVVVKVSVVAAALVAGDTKALVAVSTVVPRTTLSVCDVCGIIVVVIAEDIAALATDFTLVVGEFLLVWEFVVGKPVVPATVVVGNADDGDVLSLVDLTAEVVSDVAIWSPLVRASVVVATVFFCDTTAFVNVTRVGFW